MWKCQKKEEGNKHKSDEKAKSTMKIVRLVDRFEITLHKYIPIHLLTFKCVIRAKQQALECFASTFDTQISRVSF